MLGPLCSKQWSSATCTLNNKSHVLVSESGAFHGLTSNNYVFDILSLISDYGVCDLISSHRAVAL